jgi:phage-related protein
MPRVTPKRVSAAFYRTEPVRDWIKSLPPQDMKIVGHDLQSVEFGWPVGMPLCRPLGGGLWEVRSRITDGIARIIFFLYEGKLVVLNGFVKKTQKTPIAEIELARRRKKEIEQNGE